MSNKIFRHPLRHLLVFSLLLAVAMPALAQFGRTGGPRRNEIRVRLGLFSPDGDSEYWKFGELGDPDSPVFTGSPEDFEDLVVGAEFVHYLGPRLGFVLGVSGWEGQDDQSYLFFEDQNGGDIVHRTRVSSSAITAGFLLNLIDRNRRLVPYVGAGAGFYIWELRESGDFVDFNAFPLEIFTARFKDDGETFGWYWDAGLRVGITRNWSFVGEYRKHHADDKLSGDFEGFGKLDLSGDETTGGFVWTF